jgi:hypothetical protein
MATASAKATPSVRVRPKVAAFISAASGAVIQVLGTDDTSGKNIGAKEEQWFGIVLDELARYCHIHGLNETEKHLVAALGSWHEAQETEGIIGKVITFRPKNL